MSQERPEGTGPGNPRPDQPEGRTASQQTGPANRGLEGVPRRDLSHDQETGPKPPGNRPQDRPLAPY